MTDMPVLDIFTERFIDAFAPDGHDNCGQSSAIRRAGAVMMFSPLLTQAFRAVGIAYFGQCTGSPRIMSHGYKVYCQTLNHLQIALWDPRQSRSEGVLATVILLMAYEVRYFCICRQTPDWPLLDTGCHYRTDVFAVQSLQHTSERALIAHCMSALKLIEFRNPWSHMFGLEHLCFTELLPYWVLLATTIS
jgi:hypothetical protein